MQYKRKNCVSKTNANLHSSYDKSHQFISKLQKAFVAILKTNDQFRLDKRNDLKRIMILQRVCNYKIA